MATNNFLPFTPTDTGTNLLSQSDYAAATDRTIGNQPGVASAKLNNKALRQSSYIVSQLAQWVSDVTGADVVDDATPAKLLAQLNASLKTVLPVLSKYTSGSGNHDRSVIFFIASGSATAGATYTNNSVTFTVVATVASGVQIQMTGNGAPTVSGTLTKASGTGDATLTFYAMRLPYLMEVKIAAGGGGGGGSGSAPGTAASAGGDSTFGANTASGGAAGGSASGSGGAGGATTLGSGLAGLACPGGGGGAGIAQVTSNGVGSGTTGGCSALGGGAIAAQYNVAGGDGRVNTGGGGGGGGTNNVIGVSAGGGGGGGGYIEGIIGSPASRYAYVVGAGGANGGAGTGGVAGGTGGSGVIEVTEYF